MSDAGPIVVEVRRGARVESRHLVDAVVAAADGTISAAWGDPARPVLPRSALKPIQALPLLVTGAAAAFGVAEEELALAAASHRGERIHVDIVSGWLARLGLDVSALECGAHPPFDEASARALVAEGRPFDARHNNCAGKHCGFLCVCRHLDLATGGYIQPDHPLQRDHITPVIESLCGLSLADQTPGIDGCGIPVWSIPLDRLAAGWAALATDAVGRSVFDAMVAFPHLVAGTDGACTRLIERGGGRVVVKTGAEAVYCGLDRETGDAVALKVHDGAERAAEVAIEWVLARRGALPEPAPVPVHNWAGTQVGEIVVERER